jgi:hypothetical protein
MMRERERSYPGADTLAYVSGLAALPCLARGTGGDVAGVVAAVVLLVVLVWLF